jgi:cysteine desulfurase
MIYLDHHAATPLSAPVLAAMEAVHREAWGNPSSVHAAGRAARARLEAARRVVARAVGAQPADLVFTAGGTEACNLGILGLIGARAGGAHLVTSALEHPAVLGTLDALAQRGARVERLPLVGALPPSPDALQAALCDDTALVALQWVNHETGCIAPVQDYARICRARGVPLVVDASQVLGKLPCDVAELGASVVVFASSKLGGPAGAAALWIDRTRSFTQVSFGGAQERGRRAGTPDVATLAGFAAAVEQAPGRLAQMVRLASLRDRLEAALVALGASVNAAPASDPASRAEQPSASIPGGSRVATVSNVSVPGWRGEVLVAALDLEGLCASAGAACSSGLGAPSPVLLGLYPEAPWRAESALRLSLGPETSEVEVEQAIAILRQVLGRGA